MNGPMKAAVAEAGMQWSATLPLVLFVLFFSAVVIWTYTASPKTAPPLE